MGGSECHAASGFQAAIGSQYYLGWGVYLRISVSDSTSGGSVSLWFNDAQQTLSNGSTSYTGKTFDGRSVDPKWGIYEATGTSLHDYVRHLRIGTTLADVQF